MPTFQIPSTFYGSSSYEPNNPIVETRGFYVTHNTYIKASSYFQETDTYFHTFGLWIYYINGLIGPFASLDMQLAGNNLYQDVKTFTNGTDQSVHQSFTSSYFLEFGVIQNGWNLVMFSASTDRLIWNLWSTTSWPYWKQSSTSFTSALGVFKNDRYIGCKSCTDTNVEYIIHSLRFVYSIVSSATSSAITLFGVTNTYLSTTPTCGDGLRTFDEECDDGNTANGNGCSSTWTVESGYLCVMATGGDICSDLCGDGKVKGTRPAGYCDDGDVVSGNGCDSTCQVESGYECTGGSTSGPDICRDKWGDGKLVNGRPNSTYWDDGGTTSGNGCSATCVVEAGYTCSGATASVADTWVDKWGDGKLMGTRPNSTYCDDGDTASGNGCSATWVVESGYTCSGATTSVADTWVDKCGDGKLMGTRPNSTYCDDGDTTSGDGCSATCVVESGYTCTGATTSVADTWIDKWGDGKLMGTRPNSTYCDDGDITSGNGCSATWVVESGYIWSGATTLVADTCVDVCGDGRIMGTRPNSSYCDDGGTTSGNGCSATWVVENGYTCSGATTTTADTCSDKCGDGKLMGTRPNPTYCDDGDTISGNGCSATWVVESGYTWSGATTLVADICSDVWGDGRLMGTRPNSSYCDDGDITSGNGCSATWVVESGYTCSGATTSSADTCSDKCGDGILMGTRPNPTYCDDGGFISGDGCSPTWVVEVGYSWSGATTLVADTCSDVCGDGMVKIRSPVTYCDDGDNDNGDGCNSTWGVETGYIWDGGSLNTADTCRDVWGDGVLVGTRQPNYWDDGGFSNGDGCDSSCTVEAGWYCDGANPSTSDQWFDVCADGILMHRNSVTYCDDGGNVNGDGCDSSWQVENGYEWAGGNASRADTCYILCGDGVLTNGVEECDDGNAIAGDGCSNSWKLEANFNCKTNTSNIPATVWTEICGDGYRSSSTGCDDGNKVNGDGWSSICKVESGYTCEGGSPNSADIWAIVWGDGLSSNTDNTICDDGNTFSGDGWSSTCKVEDGYSCTKTSPSVCSEIWGDGRRVGPGWDDGNKLSGDGWSSTCTLEIGFVCSGGSKTKRDICIEICGDGNDYSSNEWEDGNLDDGDGWSSTCEYETWYEWSGGTPTNPDAWSILHITAQMSNLTSDNKLQIKFDHIMQNNVISLNDLSLIIESDQYVKFDWEASYINSTILEISLNIKSVTKGGEILTVELINDKVFRAPTGGCVTTNSFNATLTSSLESSAQSAKSISGLTKYIIMISIIFIFPTLMICGVSMELIWSLINTLQLITYLPFMTPYYPDHVKIMFEILQFVNMDISVISNMFTSLTNIDGINAPSYDSRFLDNGVSSPLFLQNCSSLIMSLMFTLLILTLLGLLYWTVRCDRARDKVSDVISSYFFNNFLRFFTEGYLEISFGAMLNVAAMTYVSIAEKISLGISALTFGLCLIFPFLTFALLYDKRKEIADGHPIYLKRFGTMYRDFKVNKQWYLFQYYSIFLIRRLIFVSFLIMLLSYPETQCNWFILFSFLIFCYQAAAKPFEEEIVNVVCCVNEGILGFISLIQIVFTTDINDVKTIDNTGWALIGMMVTMVIINFSIILPYSFYQKWTKCKKKKKNRITITGVDPIVNQTNRPTFSPGNQSSHLNTRDSHSDSSFHSRFKRQF